MSFIPAFNSVLVEEIALKLGTVFPTVNNWSQVIDVRNWVGALYLGQFTPHVQAQSTSLGYHKTDLLPREEKNAVFDIAS